MPQLGMWELLIILIIVLVIFGASRLRSIGSGLGGAINAFRREVRQGREEEAEKETAGTARKRAVAAKEPASAEEKQEEA